MPLNLGGVPADRDAPAEIFLNGNIKGKRSDNLIIWRLLRRAHDFEEVQNKNIDNSKLLPEIGQKSNDDKFILNFANFRVAHLDAIEIKISLLNENDDILGYHYISLKTVYRNSKKGKDLWLALSTKQHSNKLPKELKFPLLHLKVGSKYSDGQISTIKSPNIEKEPKFYKENQINDIFYNKSIEFPQYITPKTYKFIDILNNKWHLLEEELKYTQNEDELGEFIQRIKYKLARFYHKNTSRQMAKLKKSNYLWAILQDDITNFLPNHNEQNKMDESQLVVDESFVANLAELKRPVLNDDQFLMDSPLNVKGIDHIQVGRDPHIIDNDDLNSSPVRIKTSSKVVSYLFKRDKWENKAEWKLFYDELSHLCRKGIPPQERIQIWSELGRVVYFINLTEKVFNNIQGVHDFDKKNFNKLQKKGSDDDEYTNDKYGQKNLSSSMHVYNNLKKAAEQCNFYVYQQLEDDIQLSKDVKHKEKLQHESNIRSLCKVFIYWGYLFSKSNISMQGDSDKFRYFVSYSRLIFTIVQGLIIAQTCDYLGDSVQIEEDVCFWLLISLTTFILPGYYETSSSDVSVDNLTSKNSKERNTRL